MSISGTVTSTFASGGSPMCVVFDASSLTSTETTEPWRDCLFEWDYGDPTSGTWSVGAFQGSSRNTSRGCIGAHLYEVADSSGTTVFTPTLKILEPSGNITRPSVPTVSITDRLTHWAGNIWTISNTTDHTGAPAGATQINNVTSWSTVVSTYLQSGDRPVPLRAGHTWDTLTATSVKGNNVCIGKFGSGADPQIDAASSSGTGVVLSTANSTYNYRVQDIDFVNGAGDGNYGVDMSPPGEPKPDILLLRCSADGFANFARFNNGISAGANYVNGGGIVECACTNGTEYTGFYGAIKDYALLGNNFWNETGSTHTIRLILVQRSLLAYNDTGTRRTSAAWKIHADDESTNDTEYNVFTHNVVGGENDCGWMCNWTAQSNSSSAVGALPGYQEDVVRNLIERNFWDVLRSSAGGAQVQCLRFDNDFNCARNNVFRCRGAVPGTPQFSNFITLAAYGDEGNQAADDCLILNNTFFHNATSGTIVGVSIVNAASDNNIIKGNLLYCPDGATPDVLSDSGTNTTDSANVQTTAAGTADFTTDPPVDELDFVRTGNNADGATDDALFDDIEGNWRFGETTPDAGASETTDEGAPAGWLGGAEEVACFG